MKKREMKSSTFWIIIAIILVLIGAFSISAFKNKNKVMKPQEISNRIQQPFDAKATIKMEDLVMEADINKTEIGTLTLQIKEPKTISGMSFQYDGEDITVSYRGLSVKLNEDSKLASSAAGIIVKAIDKAASESGIDVSMEGQVLKVEGESESGEFEIRLDKSNGSMISLNIPKLDFECNFDDFIFAK